MTARKRRSLVLWRRAAGGKEGRTKNTQNKDKAGKDGAWYYDGEQQKEQEWNEEKVGRRRRRTRTKKTHEYMQDNVGGEEQFRDFEFILKTSWLYCKVPPKQESQEKILVVEIEIVQFDAFSTSQWKRRANWIEMNRTTHDKILQRVFLFCFVSQNRWDIWSRPSINPSIRPSVHPSIVKIPSQSEIKKERQREGRNNINPNTNINNHSTNRQHPNY